MHVQINERFYLISVLLYSYLSKILIMYGNFPSIATYLIKIWYACALIQLEILNNYVKEEF